jgi:hypothetical protein
MHFIFLCTGFCTSEPPVLLTISVSVLFVGCELWKATISFLMSARPSARPHGTTRLPLDGFLWNSTFEYFSNICSENSKFHSTNTKITGTLHEDQHTFIIISRSILHNMRNVSYKSLQKVKTNSLPLYIVTLSVPVFDWGPPTKGLHEEPFTTKPQTVNRKQVTSETYLWRNPRLSRWQSFAQCSV